MRINLSLKTLICKKKMSRTDYCRNLFHNTLPEKPYSFAYFFNHQLSHTSFLDLNVHLFE